MAHRLCIISFRLLQLYGRMRLCRTMVSDHFTPAYLRSMHAATSAFESGYADCGPQRH